MKSFYWLQLINLGYKLEKILYRNLYEDIFMDLKFVYIKFLYINSFGVNFDCKYLENSAFAQEINVIFVFCTWKFTTKVSYFISSNSMNTFGRSIKYFYLKKLCFHN